MILVQLVLSRTTTVKNSFSGFCAKAAETASDLWDVLWSSDTRDLKVKRGKEHLSTLERARGSHSSCWWYSKWYQQLTEKNGHFHIRQITCEVIYEVKVRKKYKPIHSILSFLIVYFLNFLLLRLFSVSYPQHMLYLPFKDIAICFWLQCHRCFTVSSFEKSIPELLWEHTAQSRRGILIETASLCFCMKTEDEVFQCGRWRWLSKQLFTFFEDLTGN